ncbi:unnamed protein product [Schistosoma mattheei]|uniref:Uncharacterized protein n=1 Tax=Schistosoma mattheei TaxID=31246 RepID=A0A183NVV5_9TREM|nr:unnamed protein product [Schistosoma mattheei]
MPWPNVCFETNPKPRQYRQRIQIPYTKLTRVWEPNCEAEGNWCIKYKEQTHYAVHYKTVFKTAPLKQFRCCPGFIRQPGYEGCVPGKHFPKNNNF